MRIPAAIESTSQHSITAELNGFVVTRSFTLGCTCSCEDEEALLLLMLLLEEAAMLDRAALHVPLSILMILVRTFISTYRICHVTDEIKVDVIL